MKEVIVTIHNKDYGLRYFCTKLWISHASNEEIIKKIINLEDKIETLKLMLKDKWDKLL